jgi:hypothetical protein
MQYRILAVIVLMLAPFGSQALDTNIMGKVQYTGTYGEGRFFVALDAQINEPGCPNTRFDVPANHPQIKNWLAIALTAVATGKNVIVRTSGCFNGLPTMTLDTNSWFYAVPY